MKETTTLPEENQAVNEAQIKLAVNQSNVNEIAQSDAATDGNLAVKKNDSALQPGVGMDSVETGRNPPSIEAMKGTDWRPNWSDVESGLSDSDHATRLAYYGPNAVPEKGSSPIWDYLMNYWGVMPIMIWLAIIILFLKCTLTPKKAWPDFIMCCVLQLVNANVKWYNTRNAKNAINALKAQMAPCSIVKRNGQWKTVEAFDLVPGDVIQVRIGDILPADCICGPAENVQVDQAALTGESLPRSIHPGGRLLASSVVKRGEGEAVVTTTGLFTVIGKTTSMIAGVKKRSRYDRILAFVALYLLSLALACMSVLFIFMMTQDPPEDILFALGVVVSILIGALPVAMHVVCMVIMAMGAFRLSEENAVVTELTATEELSGMSILCTDKTGTLTLNRLEISEEDSVTFGCENDEMLFFAALACKRGIMGQDAIDKCITNTCKSKADTWERVEKHPTTKFTPFDPIIKRTEAIIRGPDGEIFQVAKGAPQVMLDLAQNKGECGEEALRVIDKLARRGFRTLGISKGTVDGVWTLMGLLAISDPPRKDTVEVVKRAQALGIKVIMITGDQTAIAREVGRQTDIGTKILSSRLITDYDSGKLEKDLEHRIPEIIEHCDGFAEVLPEHKYRIVEILQMKGYIVGMTGDGVNDAPALKKANVGIAVSGATDAARAAASIFLKEEGLSVIITAIMRSKKVFERVKNYIIYRSATSLRLMGFFFVCAIFISPLDYLPGYEDHSDYRKYCNGDLDYLVGESSTQIVDQETQHSTCIRTPPDLRECMDQYDFDQRKLAECARAEWDPALPRTAELFVSSGTTHNFVPKPGCLDNSTALIDAATTGSDVFVLPNYHKGSLFGGIGTLGWENHCLTTLGKETIKRSILAVWQSIAVEAKTMSTDQKTHVSDDVVKSVDRLIRSDIYISNYFQPPALVIIVLTLLNDFTVITIAFDHVQISQKPNVWWLWRNITLGTVIGANTLIWSILMFLFMLNSMDPRFWGCRYLDVCLEYPEILTGTFLQLSLCARLARTNARKDDWFCTLGLNRSVVFTMSFSIIMAMLLSFTWPLCPNESDCFPRMVPLNPTMCAIIILYQIPVHLIRDCCKMLTYHWFLLLDRQTEAKERIQRKQVAAECEMLLAKYNLLSNDPSDHQVTTERRFSREESLDIGILNFKDDGPCLPFFPRWCGPKLFAYNDGGPKCGCNPLAYFVLFFVVGIVTFIL
eukprot:GEMP01004494.1.p1 GENE.GEMP01004494.1~~GEMP01004494.1.p1  ORF type:complete len:1209 (+),score=244.14 GEMP01004494.1:280-3906(+)